MNLVPDRWSRWFAGLSDRDRRALGLLALALVPTILFLGVVRPYRTALAEATERMSIESGVLQRERALLANAAPLMEALAVATAEAETAQLRLVTAANTALAERELTERLEGMAFVGRVLLQDLRSVEPDRDEEPPAGLRPVRLEVRGESDMEGVLSFLRQVETSPLLVRVSGLSLQPEMARPQGRGGRGNDEERLPPRPTGVVEFVMVVEAYAQVGTESEGALNIGMEREES